jgi:hypothetical protein
VTIDLVDASPVTQSVLANLALQEGKHRRVYGELVVHLVFNDMSEHRLGADTAIGRSLGHLACWLVER